MSDEKTVVLVLEDSPAHELIQREFLEKPVVSGALAVTKEELESWRKDTEIVNMIVGEPPPEPGSGPNWWPPGWLPIGRKQEDE